MFLQLKKEGLEDRRLDESAGQLPHNAIIKGGENACGGRERLLMKGLKKGRAVEVKPQLGDIKREVYCRVAHDSRSLGCQQGEERK